MKCPTDLDHKAAVRGQCLAYLVGELSEPLDVVCFPIRAVFLLMGQVERGGRDDEIDLVGREFLQEIATVAEICRAV